MVQNTVTAHGHPLRRVWTISVKHRVVTEQSLYTHGATPLAVAKFSSHGYDSATGAVLPRKITLEWPQSKMSVSMDFKKIEINPASMSPELWAMPAHSGSPVVHLDADLPPTRVATISHEFDDEAIIRMNGIEDPPLDDSDDELIPDDDSDEFQGRTFLSTGHSRLSTGTRKLSRSRLVEEDLTE